jgi:hypothetical protein
MVLQALNYLKNLGTKWEGVNVCICFYFKSIFAFARKNFMKNQSMDCTFRNKISSITTGF